MHVHYAVRPSDLRLTSEIETVNAMSSFCSLVNTTSSSPTYPCCNCELAVELLVDEIEPGLELLQLLLGQRAEAGKLQTLLFCIK